MPLRRAFSEIGNVAEARYEKPSIKKPVEGKKICVLKRKSNQAEALRINPSDRTTVENIDAHYKGHTPFLAEYASNVFAYLMTIESRTPIRAWPLSPNVTPHMRGKVIDWIASIVNDRCLHQETFQLTVYLFDSYVQSHAVDKETIQLIAICCLSLAVKYEESHDIRLTDLLALTVNAYTRNEFQRMEISVLKNVNCSLGRPLPITFLRRFNMVVKAGTLQHTYGKFLIDLCMLEAYFCHIPPSLLAAASTFIALCLIKKEVSPEFWTPTLAHYTTYSFERLKPFMAVMATVLKTRGGEFSEIREKYSKAQHHEVSKRIGRNDLTLLALRKLK